MKTLKVLLALTLLSTLVFYGCSRRTQKSLQANEPVLPEGMIEKPLAERNNHFAFSLYRQLPVENENFVMSPFSISSALAMTYAGAREQTAEEMARTLMFHPDQEVFHPEYGEFLQGLREQAGEAIQLNLANSLWVQQDHPFLPGFFELVETRHGALVMPVNYLGDREAIRQDINDWVYEETREKIENLIGPMVLTEDTRMVLVNAVHFFGPWKQEFDPERTSQDYFTGLDGQRSQADFMYASEEFLYYEEEQFQVLSIPYSEDRFSMVLLLPSRDSSLPEVEATLDADRFKNIINRLETRKVNVLLPRFEAESQIDLEEVLAAMGMPRAFSNRADFSGMTGETDLKIDKVIHKAMIEVAEEGTEAAAATAVVMIVKTSVDPEERTVFRADRPFFFAIRDNRYNSVLFMGRVVRP